VPTSLYPQSRRRRYPLAATGGGGFTDPTDLPNLVYWYDATDASTFTFSSGVIVSQWNDKSGNAYHMTPPGTGPNRVTVASYLAVYFDAKPLSYVGSNVVSGTTLTVSTVHRLDGTSQGTNRQFSCGGTGTTDWSHASGYTDNIEGGPESYPSGYRGGTRLSDHTPAVSLTWLVKTWVFDGSTSVLYLNGVAEASDSSTGTFDIDEWCFGAHHGSFVFPGFSWVNDGVMCATNLTGSDLTNLIDFQMTKVGL
jgi:hypothetical protein